MGNQLVFDQTQKVSYAIPLHLRDEFVRANSKLVTKRLPLQKPPLQNEPVAIVCYGPSLNDTWEQIRGFKHVITCSGAHKFLIERGIIPTHHIDVDPRPHKITLMGDVHPDVAYYPASACHPDYVKYLLKHTDNVTLWHVFDPNEDPMRMLPPNEWALVGGCSAGLRALVLARFLGFTDMHIFGMDGSEGASGKHAGAHPNQAKQKFEVEYDGKTYLTTPAFLEAAKTTPHEIDQLVDVNATFYGDGLVQAIMRNYKRTTLKNVPIGIVKPELISAEMRKLNAQLHEDRVDFGVNGGRHAKAVTTLRNSIKATSVLDYGCGKAGLSKALTFPIWNYDPAIPEYAEPPRAADLVVCTDVLEHIEPDKLLHVLADLKRCVKQIGYFVISTRKAVKTYADGRNTHLIVEGEDFWRRHIKAFFNIGSINRVGDELHVVVGVKINSTKQVVKAKNKVTTV